MPGQPEYIAQLESDALHFAACDDPASFRALNHTLLELEAYGVRFAVPRVCRPDLQLIDPRRQELSPPRTRYGFVD